MGGVVGSDAEGTAVLTVDAGPRGSKKERNRREQVPLEELVEKGRKKVVRVIATAQPSDTGDRRALAPTHRAGRDLNSDCWRLNRQAGISRFVSNFLLTLPKG